MWVPLIEAEDLSKTIHEKLDIHLRPPEISYIFFPEEDYPEGCAKQIYFNEFNIKGEEEVLKYLLEYQEDIQNTTIKIAIMKMLNEQYGDTSDFILVNFPFEGGW